MWDILILNPMIAVLMGIYRPFSNLVGGFGIAIILFTVIMRLVTAPLTAKQMKSTQAMQEFQKSKKWQDIQAKYKNDKQKLQQEQMKLYKEMGINPFGSCLPLLIQFPIIIGLYQSIIQALATTPIKMTAFFHHVSPPVLTDIYRSIYNVLDLGQLLPINSTFLWMDLTQPERLYIMGFGIPVMAIIVVITTYMQSKLMTPPSQPGDQGAQMSQAMNLYMPFLMGYFALTFASGLALYFITTNVVSIVQYAMMGKVNWRNLLPTRKVSARKSE